MPHDTVWYTRCPVPSPLGIAARFGWIDAAFGAWRGGALDRGLA
jgi:hypothetical protein